MKLSFFLCILYIVHGMDIATFTITQNNNYLYVEASLDIADTLKALHIEKTEDISKEILEAYFNDKMSYVINGAISKFEIRNFYIEDEHIIIHKVSKTEVHFIKTLQIENKALFEVNSLHSNVIKLRYNTNHRDFLINAQRPKLTINL